MKKKGGFLKRIFQNIPMYFFILLLVLTPIVIGTSIYDGLARTYSWPRIPIYEAVEKKQDAMREFDKVYSFEGLKIYVYRDTGVMYCGNSEDGMTVMLNADGSPMIWKEGN